MLDVWDLFAMMGVYFMYDMLYCLHNCRSNVIAEQ